MFLSLNAMALKRLKAASDRREKASRRTSFFVRLVDVDNTTLFLSHPRLWEQFDLTRPQDQVLEGQWHYYTSKRDGDLLEVASARLKDGKLLQVGKSIQDRDEVLEHFRDTLLATIIPMVLIGFAGGAFLAFRALRPIRDLSGVARSIVDTARFDARVPGSKTADELDELVVLFNQMLEKIEILIRGMKDSLDNVAHDLRTPVTRLRVTAEEALRSGAGREACREALADCLEESERVMTMLNTLMDISEAETGTMKLSLENINLGALVEEVVELYDDVADEKSIKLSTNAPSDVYLRADRVRLRQVLANLVDNAVKYTPSGGSIDIEALKKASRQFCSSKTAGLEYPSMKFPGSGIAFTAAIRAGRNEALGWGSVSSKRWSRHTTAKSKPLRIRAEALYFSCICRLPPQPSFPTFQICNVSEMSWQCFRITWRLAWRRLLFMHRCVTADRE